MDEKTGACGCGQNLKLKIITGMSGAGKTQIIHVLEDLGYYCVDNLPPKLFMHFIETVQQTHGTITETAIVADVRGGLFFPDLFAAFREMHEAHIDFEIIFLDAADHVLVRRFKETRRRHPLSQGDSLTEAIAQERQRLQELRGMAHYIIDTSNTTGKALYAQVNQLFGQQEKVEILITSFGYKYGLPIDADMIFDARFLPNPFYIEELKPLCGLDQPVRDYVLNMQAAREFISRCAELIALIMPYYEKEGKRYLHIGVGCTGGQHRSVAIVEGLAEKLRAAGYGVYADHPYCYRAGEGFE
ncbi:MAG: RNase adapter RapZ [Peptococcaceae bacterium]|jgi:UPF0042 nucleotide-binding protein|nr:RNase adapter RapZ [Peptococcaceae bacterium]